MKNKYSIKTDNKAYSRLHFEINQYGLKCKHSQADIIITVLLILVSIAAVVLIGGFAMDYISNLGTLETANVFIDSSSMAPFYYSDTGRVYVVIGRGSDNVNLSGVKITISSKESAKTYFYRTAPQISEWKLYAPGQFSTKPDTVQVAAVVSSKGKDKTLEISEGTNIIESNQFFSGIETDAFLVGFEDLPPVAEVGEVRTD